MADGPPSRVPAIPAWHRNVSWLNEYLPEPSQLATEHDCRVRCSLAKHPSTPRCRAVGTDTTRDTRAPGIVNLAKSTDELPVLLATLSRRGNSHEHT